MKSAQCYPKPKIGCINIFQQVNHRGDSKTLCNAHITGNQVAWHNTLGSHIGAPLTRVTFYIKEHFNGKSTTLVKSTSNFKKSFFKNKKVLSLSVDIVANKSTAVLFEKKDYEGKHIIIKDNTIENLAAIGWSITVGSVVVAKNIRFILFENTNYLGKNVEITKDKQDFIPEFNMVPGSCKLIQSIKPQVKEGCIILFTKENYEGDSNTLCQPEYDTISNWAGPTGSILIGDKTKATIWEERSKQGKKKTIVNNVKIFKNLKMPTVRSVSINKTKISNKKGPISTWRNHLIDSSNGKVSKRPVEDPNHGCVMIYLGKEYKGEKKHVCGNWKKLNKKWLNNVNSFRLGPNTYAIFFSGANYTGTKAKQVKDLTSFTFGSMDKVASIKTFKIKGGNNTKKYPISHWRSVTVDSKDGKVTGEPIVKPIPTPKFASSGCVIIFSETNFKGKSQHVCKSVGNVLALSNVHKIKSFKLGKDTTITIYKDEYFLGKKAQKTTDEFDLKLWNHTLSFKVGLNIKKGCIVIYQDANYGGSSKVICENVENLDAIKFDKKITGIRLGPKTTVKLYESIGLVGKHVHITHDVNNLTSKGWNDKGSSIKIFFVKPKAVPGCVVLFDEANYNGNSKLVCKTIIDLKSIKWNNKISSVQVGEGTKVTLFTNIG